jgi:hypothetical protein
MYRTSLALKRQSSYLQQAPLSNDGRGKQRELIGYGAYCRVSSSEEGTLTHSNVVVYGGIHDGSAKDRRNYRRWIDGWK